MGWAPTPQRRILLEHASFIYAFGNTKYRSVYRDEAKQEVHKILLLGFGDVRNALATAAAAAGSAAAATGKSASQLKELHFDLCDISPLNVARGLLLLHLASTLDPTIPEDLDFLWGATYCLRLPAQHAARLAAAARALLGQPGGLGLQAGDAAIAAAVERVVRGWLETAPRPVAEVEAERQRLLMQRLGSKRQQTIGSEGELKGLYEAQAGGVLANLLPWPPRGGSMQGMGITNQALVKECSEFYMTGSIYPRRVTTSGTASNGTASNGTASSSSGAAGAWVVNPTLLQPGSQRWLLHYGLLPFVSYLPLDPAKHGNIGTSQAPGALTEACQAKLAVLVRGWQACRARCTVTARFWCCDALALCSRLRAPALLVAQQQQQGLEGQQPEGQKQDRQQQQQGEDAKPAEQACFDAIDVSNLPDHVGLLNVLTQAGPLLRQAPHSRLFTGHMLWVTGARRLGEYVRLACGADPQLFPTLLGLRLVNDPQYGLTLPHSPMISYAQTDLEDVLEWMPAPLQPAGVPSRAEGDGISRALLSWGDLTCAHKACPLQDRSGLALSSPLTLLHAVAGLAGRVHSVLPPGTSSWRQLADGVATLCAVPEQHRMQLRALCCWALVQHGTTAGTAAGTAVTAACTTSGTTAGAAQPPILVRGRLPMSAIYRLSQQQAGTPLLTLHLVHIPPGTPLPDLVADLMKTAQGMRAAGGAGPAGPWGSGQAARHIHVMDVLTFDVETQEVAFLLPPDHGLDVSNAAVTLIDAASACSLTEGPAVPLGTLRMTPCTPGAADLAPPALTAALLRLLAEAETAGRTGGTVERPAEPPAAAGSTASGGSSGSGTGTTGVQLSPGMHLRRLTEHAGSFEIELEVGGSLGGTVSSAGLGLEFPGAPPGGGPCQQLKLSLTQPAALRAAISFAWPVDSLTTSVRVRRSARTVSATLSKSPVWPSDQSWLLPKLAAERLPDWGAGEGPLGELSMHMSSMFSHAELQAKARGASPGSTSFDPMFDAKECLQALFVRTFQGMRAHGLHAISSPGKDEPSVTLYVHGDGPTGVRRLPDGRPLLHVSWADHEAARRMFTTPESRAAPHARFTKFIQYVGGFTGMNRVNCTDGELRLVRALLARNAMRMRVPSWQTRLLELPSDWGASFLVPAYSDHVEDPAKGGSLLDSVGSGGISSNTATASAGSSVGASGLAAAEQHKEAGNAAFKQKRYAGAAEAYRRGVAALQAPQEQQQRQQEQRRLLMIDISNNLALTLIRQAEAEPAGAAARLADAEASCSRALALEAGNSKALYRRALARYKQGKAAAAQADLNTLPPGGEDPAVVALRRQVQAALNL